MPGMSDLSATILLTEIGGKKKSSRISKAGQYLKPMLVQCALAAIKSKQEPYFARKYQRIKSRRGHKKAIIAIARMMLVCIFHMIAEDSPFEPNDYDELSNPHFYATKNLRRYLIDKFSLGPTVLCISLTVHQYPVRHTSHG